MIEGIKSYPAMKDSGVPWLGEVPADWNVTALRALTVVKKGRQPTKLFGPERPAQGVPYQSMNYMRSARRDPTEFALPEPGLVVAENGATVLLWDGANAGEFFRARGGVVSSTSALVTPRGIAPDYFFYACQVIEPHLRALTVGMGIPHVDGNVLKSLHVLVPSSSEQAAIVRFLDYVDRRIRRYIRAKQKLIKLLDEQKQAIIHRAVTRGLDPNVRLKPSGVEWLGDVPEHWEVSQIRSVAHVVRGGSPRPAGSPLYFHGTGAPWITVGEVTRASGIYVTETATRLTPAGAERSRMIEPGTLLLTNSGATLGFPRISRIQGCINDGVAAFLNLRPRIRKEFLLRYFTTQTVHLKAWVDLGAQPNLNTQIIGSWPVPIPTIEEQDRIVQHIEQSTNALHQTADRTRSEIDLLREYRTRLIADVVTGKRDVREAAARLPDDDPLRASASPREIEPLDDIEAEGDLDKAGADDTYAVPEEAEA